MKISNKPIAVYCVELKKIFPSMYSVEKELRIPQSNIKKCLKGERKTAGGYRWTYLKKGE